MPNKPARREEGPMNSFAHRYGTVLVLAGLLFGASSLSSVDAAERSFYSPLIAVNKERGFIVVSDSGKVFGVLVPEEAKPHLDKLPVMGMIDIVVELKADAEPDAAPVLKTWKVMSGESSCKYFDGKTCK
jgi:hypothetical protein